MKNYFLFNKSFSLFKIFLGFHLVQKYAVNFCLSNGPSMSPTISPDGEILIYERLRVLFSRMFKSLYSDPIKKGSIVIAYSKEDPNLRICKRVIAKAGDLVTLYPNYTLVTTVNCRSTDVILDEIRNNGQCNIIVPKDHYWIQGDNIFNSRDSRHYGPIHESMIIGRVLYRMVSLKLKIKPRQLLL
ncbi:hypothetical protein FG386_001346 [Cryptosporidium ryanae]|uniref:uncharacterized protein n=1 Tax=Cryptosporidium ryanae TaxID=515981 RepID=UPI003519F844|nr:hypothetical protein FG386_001346 [Cryptosporidium ryanae]